MYNLLTIRTQDFLPDSPMVDSSNFRTREAARAVLLDASGRVYLLNVRLHGYHKLPGGGIKSDETIQEALVRELMEEVGCKAEILAELGTIIEYRDDQNLKQTSYCFLARQIDEQSASSLEEGELAEGMVETKASSTDEAIELLSNDTPDNIEGKFIQKRDICFLKTVLAAESSKYID